jgi:hypothetical protein
MIIGKSEKILISLQISKPSLSVSAGSSSMSAGGFSPLQSRSASAPLYVCTASYPSRLSASFKASQVVLSSSTTKIRSISTHLYINYSAL